MTTELDGARLRVDASGLPVAPELAESGAPKKAKR